MKRFWLLGLGAALVTGTAHAQTLLQDAFTTENGGATAINYDGFTNWSVSGKVDLVSNFSGITCTGPCVDLDGSPGPGSITSKQNFAFNSGDVMRITFDISGNQRNGNPDTFFLYLNFTQNTQLGQYFGTGGLSGFSGASLFDDDFEVMPSIAGNTPFSTWSFQFAAASAGTVRYTLGTTSQDNQGPLVDNVLVERVQVNSVVPEPSTWAMLAFGLGSLGVVARRRVRKV